jgi:hypothetical protein
VSHEVDVDPSLHGVRVGTEALIKPGDQVSLTLRLPNDTVPAAIALTVVRLTKGLVDGLALKRLAQSSRKGLTECNKAAGLAKEETIWTI